MEKIKVKKSELVNILTRNMAKHISIFDKAIKEYRKEVIKQLDNALKMARKGKGLQLFFNITQPMNQEDSYERAILMLNMSVDDVIELNERDFMQYVQDKWSWTDQFVATNSVYTSMK